MSRRTKIFKNHIKIIRIILKYKNISSYWVAAITDDMNGHIWSNIKFS